MQKKIKSNGNYKAVGLALSGGSALGISHIGAIKCLRENGVPIDCVAGTSAGSVVAACIAFDVPLEKMIEVSQKLSWSNMGDFGFSKFGFNSNEPLGKILKDLLGNVRIENAKIPLAIVAADIDTGEKIVFRSGKVIDALRASTCIPAFFSPVKIGRKNLVDGGLVENLPFSPLKEMGAELEIGINLGHYRTYNKTHNILDVINNSYGILIEHQSIYNSVHDCKVAKAANRSRIIIEPHLEKYTPSDFAKTKQLLKAGNDAALLMLPTIKKRLAEKTIAMLIRQGFANFLHLFQNNKR